MSALSIVVGGWLVLNAAFVIAMALLRDKTRRPRIENPIDSPS
jgi:hypothetical protein